MATPQHVKTWVEQADADLRASRATADELGECHRRYWIQQSFEKGIKRLEDQATRIQVGWQATAALVCCGLALLGFALAAIGANAQPGGVSLGLILLVAAALIASNRSTAVTRRRRADAAVANAQQDAANYERFLADPGGYPWLRSMWSEHRLIFEIAIPDGPPMSVPGSSQTFVERKIVERQLVVVRCRFCKQLSPVDRPSCEHCGAAGFGSSQG